MPAFRCVSLATMAGIVEFARWRKRQLPGLPGLLFRGRDRSVLEGWSLLRPSAQPLPRGPGKPGRKIGRNVHRKACLEGRQRGIADIVGPRAPKARSAPPRRRGPRACPRGNAMPPTGVPRIATKPGAPNRSLKGLGEQSLPMSTSHKTAKQPSIHHWPGRGETTRRCSHMIAALRAQSRRFSEVRRRVTRPLFRRCASTLPTRSRTIMERQ